MSPKASATNLPFARRDGVSLKQQAYERVKEDIVQGRLPFGAVLSPRKLGREMGMSFLPIADALRLLEAEGLVETKDRVGSRVRVPTREDIEGVFTVRAALEAEVARLCAQRTSKDQRAMLRAMAREVDERYARCERDETNRELWVQTSIFHVEFHRTLASSAGCPMLTDAIQRTQVLTFKVLFDAALSRKKRPGNWHASLVDSILQGDPRKAGEAARAHVRYGIDEIIECVESIQVDNRWRDYPPRNAELPIRSR